MNPSMSLHRLLAVFFGLLLIGLAYWPGAGGALFYDDFGNLEGLASVSDWASAKQFAFGGIAGPLGRPISLLSFVPHAQGWPENTRNILQVNILIHVCNAGLLGILGYWLLKWRPAFAEDAGKRFWAALGAVFLWACIPLLASASLIAIQRMTGLAAFFSLLGLLAFTAGYRWEVQRPWLALCLQGLGLGLGTVLAMLAKENGALTPVFALLIDVFIVGKRKDVNPVTAGIRRWVLAAALLTLLIYLSPLMRNWTSISSVRGFSVWDRVQTEVVVLWQYLQAGLLPRPSLYGPFHDHRGIDYHGLPSLLAALAWMLALLSTLWLAWKKAIIWPAFAVCWFLVGHLLESTSVLLEIYFEHRNYLAMYGICLALAVAAASVGGAYRRVAVFLFGLYAALHFAVLLMLTTFWGDADRAADIWAHENPASARAAIHAVFRRAAADDKAVAEMNASLIRRQRYEYSRDIVLSRTAKHCPECVGVRLQMVIYGCLLGDPQGQRRDFDTAVEYATRGKEPRAVVDSLFSLRELVNKQHCTALHREDLLKLIGILLGNQLYDIAHIKARLLFIAAALEEDLGRPDQRDAFLADAEAVSPTALPVLQYQVYSALKEGRQDAAEQAIRRRYDKIGLTSGAMGKNELDALMDEIKSEPSR